MRTFGKKDILNFSLTSNILKSLKKEKEINTSVFLEITVKCKE